MFLRRVYPLLVVVSILMLTASTVSAQLVSGHIVDSISGSPVGTGFVVLLDEENREVARTLSAADGSFLLAAPTAGAYRVRSERIGYVSFTSPFFEIADDQLAELTLRVLAQAIVLATVEVQAEDRCNTNPDEAEQTGLIWEEIRKALSATAWDSTQELAQYRAYRYRRSRDLQGENVLSEEGQLSGGYARQPYVSDPIERLLEVGFVLEDADSTTYNLPDAAALQHEDFLASHCFFVVRDSAARPGQVGLAFEPLARRGVADVRGALWLDEESSELRTLEVRYTRLPHDLRDDRVGGTLEFFMLPSGAWVVHRWQVRTPDIRAITGGVREIGDRDRRLEIMGYNDTGAEVLEITTREGEKVHPPGLAHLVGTVFDSSRNGALEGATVAIEGTEFWVSTDENGDFHLTATLLGNHVAVVSHPFLDSIGYTTPRIEISMAPDDTTSISFSIPHANALARRLCAYDPGVRDSATVLGVVRWGRTGRPAAEREVWATWQVVEDGGGYSTARSFEKSAWTNRSGAYVLCGLPIGVPVSIEVDDARSADLIFPKAEGGALLMARERSPQQPYTRSFTTRHRTWKVDLLLTDNAAAAPRQVNGCRLSGYVYDRASGRPINDAEVVLNNADSTASRIDGTFDLVGVSWIVGDNQVSVSRRGYDSWGSNLRVGSDDACVEIGIELQRTQTP